MNKSNDSNSNGSNFQSFVYHNITARLAQFPKLHSFVRAIYRSCYEETNINPNYRLSQSLILAQQKIRTQNLPDITIGKKFIWTTRDDFKLPYDPRIRTGYYPFSEKMTSIADEQLFAVIKKKSKHSPTIVLDIGANIGVTAVGFSKLFEKATIYAYEPVPSTFAILSALVFENKNKLSKIVPKQLAIGKQIGEIFMTTDLNTGNHVVNQKGKNTTRVQVTTIDEQVAKIGKAPQLIKIDVEGLEWSVLLGAQKTLRAHKPMLVLELYEPWLKRFGTNANQIIAFLQSVGYEYYCVDTATNANANGSVAADLKKNINFIFY